MMASMTSATEVETFWAGLDHPLAGLAARVREDILAIGPDIVETIKWNAPNFDRGVDFATFNFRRPQAVLLILHTGARPKPEQPDIILADPLHLATRPDRNRAIIVLTPAHDTDEALHAVRAVVRSWLSQLV